jgi:malic enzyme
LAGIASIRKQAWPTTQLEPVKIIAATSGSKLLRAKPNDLTVSFNRFLMFPVIFNLDAPF